MRETEREEEGLKEKEMGGTKRETEGDEESVKRETVRQRLREST